jgi:hypothetical protein
MKMIDSCPYERHEAILRQFPGLYQHLMEREIILTLLKHFTIIGNGRRTGPIINKDAR